MLLFWEVPIKKLTWIFTLRPTYLLFSHALLLCAVLQLHLVKKPLKWRLCLRQRPSPGFGSRFSIVRMVPSLCATECTPATLTSTSMSCSQANTWQSHRSFWKVAYVQNSCTHWCDLTFAVADVYLSSSGPVYHEGCDCPQTSASLWETHMHCPQSFPQIDQDLSLFSSVDPDRNAQEIPQRFGQRQSLCHYTIKDNKVPLGMIRLD